MERGPTPIGPQGTAQHKHPSPHTRRRRAPPTQTIAVHPRVTNSTQHARSNVGGASCTTCFPSTDKHTSPSRTPLQAGDSSRHHTRDETLAEARNNAPHTPPVHSQKQKLSMNGGGQAHTSSSNETHYAAEDCSFQPPLNVVRRGTNWSTRRPHIPRAHALHTPITHSQKQKLSMR